MTETKKPAAATPHQLLIDLGPTVLFVVAYNVLERIASLKDNAAYIATGLFIASTLIAIAYTRLTTGRVSLPLIVTGVIVTAFGGMTILMHDVTFMKLRPTIADAFYAVAITGSVLIGQNVWKLLFGHVFTLPDRIWNILALRWAAFFAVLACANEVMRNTLTTEGWVTWHFPVLYVPTLLFAVANTPFVLKHQPPEEPKPVA